MSIWICTVVGPLPLLLLSTEIVVAPEQDNDNDHGSDDDNDEKSEDEDEVKPEEAIEVDNMVKVTHPRNSLPPMLGASMHVVYILS
nr:DExH-box ATP-dependent RNA helicase DExH6-like [Arachis hypogaea]XP_025703299.1 DExH-box ATP-dependent RNA helicase DExH6-like [Arachis hypogaea]